MAPGSVVATAPRSVVAMAPRFCRGHGFMVPNPDVTMAPICRGRAVRKGSRWWSQRGRTMERDSTE